MGNPWDKNWEQGQSLGKKSGQGHTFHVTRRANEQSGVLKTLRNNKCTASRARMHREAACLQLLNTVNASVPRLLDHNTNQHQDGKTPLFIVTEFIDGPTLQEHVDNNGVLSIDDAITLVLAVANTLRAGHLEGILHRDLKPDNIIIRSNILTTPVVIDYGLSFNANDDDVTQTGETFRNKFLDLPETNTPNGLFRDQRSDITTLSAILYFALTGHRIGHLADAQNKLPHRRERFSIKDSSEGDLRVLYLKTLFDRAFQPAIEFRFQTIDDLVSRLTDISKSHSESQAQLRELAKHAYEQLQSRDRKTQLAEMQRLCQPVPAFFQNLCSQFAREIDPFSFIPQSFSTKQVPAPYEPIFPQGIVWLMKSPAGQLTRLCFAIAAQGPECVILFHEAVNQASNPANGPWRPLVSFLPGQNDALQLVQAVVQSELKSLLLRIINDS